MDAKQIMKIFEDTAYIRMGGTEAELKCANYLTQKCADMGLSAARRDRPCRSAAKAARPTASATRSGPRKYRPPNSREHISKEFASLLKIKSGMVSLL